MTAVVIESNVPMCARNQRGGREKRMMYPFADMSAGDSFAIERPEDQNERRRVSGLLWQQAAYFRKTYQPNWRFAVRVLETEIRIWRTA